MSELRKVEVYAHAGDIYRRCSPFVRLGRRSEMYNDILVVHNDRLTPGKLETFMPNIVHDCIFVLLLQCKENQSQG